MTTQTLRRVTVEDKLQQAYDLFEPHLPPNTLLEIEETDCRLLSKCIVSLQYKSSTGNVLRVTAKGDAVPTEQNGLLSFYLHQIILTPREIGKEFRKRKQLDLRARRSAEEIF